MTNILVEISRYIAGSSGPFGGRKGRKKRIDCKIGNINSVSRR